MKLSDMRWLVRAVKRGAAGARVDYEKYRNITDALKSDMNAKLITGTDVSAYYSAAGRVGSRIKRFLEKATDGIDVTECVCCAAYYCDEALPHSTDSDGSGGSLCAYCYSTNYTPCRGRCGTSVHTDEARSRRGSYFCESCFDDRYATCGGCEDTYSRDDMSWDDDNDEYRCSDCGGGHDSRVRGYSEDVCYTFAGTKWLSAPGEATDTKGNGRSKTPTLWMGWELEVQTRGVFKDAVSAMLDAANSRAILKDDSSIEGAGFEIVSLPGTIAFHQTQWGDAFFEPLAKHCRGWGVSSCGMHVHLSRSALTHLQLGRFASFIGAPDNSEFIQKVAGRSHNHYSQVLSKKITDIKRSNWMSGRGAEGLAYSAESGRDRYQAVNLQKEETVEVRIFQSNVSRVGFLKNLEFCDALANFCRVASNTQLTKADFLKWMDMHRGTYPNFTKWGVREGLMKTRHVAKPGSTELIVAA